MLVEWPSFDLARRQPWRLDRQQTFEVGCAEIRATRIASRAVRLIGSKDFKQRSQRARVAAIMDDGQLGGDQRRKQQSADDRAAKDKHGKGRLHVSYPRRAIRRQWAATFLR